MLILRNAHSPLIPPTGGADYSNDLNTRFEFLLTLCGLLGSNEVAENIVPTVFWLVVWIVVPLSCGVLGDWTRTVNPYANLVRLVDRPGIRRAILARGEPLTYPQWVGWWPAVLPSITDAVASRPRSTATALAPCRGDRRTQTRSGRRASGLRLP
jgi:hypothetical protein